MNSQAQQMKLPPHSVEAEQAVLGGLLQDNTAYDRIADQLAEADFYRAEHRSIFRVVLSLIDKSRPADVVTVAERMEAVGELETMGGLPYLVSLANNTPSTANIRTYAGIVRERAIHRKLIETGNRMADDAYNPGKPAVQLLADAQQALSECETHSAGIEARPMRDVLRGMVEHVDAMFHGKAQFLKTGFKHLDEKIMGLEPGDMVVVAARPSIGKTAFAVQIAEHVALTEQVLIFSLEMRAEQLAMRRAAAHAKIDLLALRSGRLEEDDWSRLTYAVGKLRERNLLIDDRAGLSMSQIRARARKVKRQHGLGVIVIDYMGLIQGKVGENRTNEVSEISRQIKGMARELDVPVIALSQLNRGLESRTGKRPVMSDLRDSGSIEQDADLILLLHREDYYNPDTQWKGVAECIIAKQRNGPTGMVPLAFHHEHAHFADFLGSYAPENSSSKPVRKGLN